MLIIYCDAVFSRDLLEKYNAAMDWMSFGFIVWNFGVVGMIAIFWKGPLRLMQFYHIITSALIVQ